MTAIGRPTRLDAMTDLGFHTAYRVFAEALEMLAAEAEEQCAAMGDFNVAWELKDDVQAGKYLVGHGHLSAEQEAWILALVCALDAVPTTIFPGGAGRDVNLAAMRHPSWVPIRVLAARTMDALVAASASNARYLSLL